MKKFHPALFSTPMVQAILERRKKKTRRTKGLECVNGNPDLYVWLDDYPQEDIPRKAIRYDDNFYYAFTGKHNNSSLIVTTCPYGKVGDVLWVRETIRQYCFVDEHGYTHFDKEIIEYAADNPEPIYLVDGDGRIMANKDGSEKFVPWKPSIFMPKAACRIFLEITDIKVERLQDISGYDVLREGVGHPLPKARSMTQASIDYKYAEPELKKQFQTLWQKINGPKSWKANPFVWVIEFKQIEKPKNFC